MNGLTAIREDLKDIRYYYAHKEVFDRASRENVRSSVIQKAERYNRIMYRCICRTTHRLRLHMTAITLSIT